MKSRDMNIVIRADTSAQIGTGHVMRCLALSQRWRDQGGQAIFVLATKSHSLEARLILEGMEVVYLSGEAGSNQDAQQTIDFCQQFSAQWIILDGYHFGASYQKAIKNFGVSLLYFDDNGHADHYYADLILNQNISANIVLYQSREPYTQLLLGTQYVLLRKEFLAWKNWQRVINPIASKILVTLGGSDPDNVTLKVIQALQQVNSDNLEVIVVVGGSSLHYEKLQAEVSESTILIALQRDVSNMPELMAWADIAIAAGGSTIWELAFMGLPSVVITIAENQIAIATELDARNLIVHLGWYQQITLEQVGLAIEELIDKSNQREEMSKKGRELVDGNGANLVASKMINMLA
jgi:UDP-2,4-diacetamido-2,4,6-trideoxy-beta-L-altropyranose hydrolase